MKPFEFTCPFGRFRILNDRCECRICEHWVRVDQGNPAKIGNFVRTRA